MQLRSCCEPHQRQDPVSPHAGVSELAACAGGGMFGALPFRLSPSLRVSAVPSLSVSQGGKQPTYALMLTSKHLMFAPPRVRG